MASVNRVTLIGNLGKDPELRFTPSGSAVCNLSVATSRKWKSRDSGELQEETEWHRVVIYDKQAEAAGQYLKKGRPVYIEGRLKTRKWQDKEVRDTYTTEIICESMQFLGSREDGGDGKQRSASAPAPAPTRHGDRPGARPAPAPAGGGAPTGFDDMADDIPFAVADFSADMQTGIARRMNRYKF